MTDIENVDMSAFLVDDSIKSEHKPVVVTGKANKKKKSRSSPYDRKGDTELQDMRATAKSLCNSYEQYRSVSKYKKERLRDWLEQKQFDNDAVLRESVFSFAHKAYAYAVDFLTKGGGHVKERMSNDLSLRTAIEDEGRDMVKWLNNKSKIAFLTMNDTFEGKMEQRIEDKNNTPATIEEIHQEYGTTGTEATNADNHETRDDILGEQQTADDEQVLSVSVREEEVQTAAEVLPGTDQGEATFEFDLREEGLGENAFDGEVVEEQPGMV